jgi:hypothetical protein
MTSAVSNDESYRGARFPAWRLTNGVKNAKDGELTRSTESCGTWALWCGSLVVLGLLLEIGLAYLHPKYDNPLERWGSVATTALVALGVAGEVFFSRMGHSRDSELQRRSNYRLAEAIERAANAERATEQLRARTAWRSLDTETITKLFGSLSAMAPASLSLTFMANDPESQNFAAQIAETFRAAGWEVTLVVGMYKADEFVTGIRIPDLPAGHPGAGNAAKVQTAFTVAGIEFIPANPPHPFMTNASGDYLREGFAWMYVGPKPMPAAI